MTKRLVSHQLRGLSIVAAALFAGCATMSSKANVSTALAPLCNDNTRRG